MENKQEQIPLSEGTKMILNTIQKELFPTLNKIKKLLINVQGCRIKYFIYSSNLNNLESEYNDISVEFFNVARKLETPDILFKGLEPNPMNIAGYFQFQEATSKNIKEGYNYIDILDRTLDRKRESIQNSRTLVLAFVAIFLSILTLK